MERLYKKGRIKTWILKLSLRSLLNPINKKNELRIAKTKTIEIADFPKMYSELKSPTDKIITERINFCLLLFKNLEIKLPKLPIFFRCPLSVPPALFRLNIKLLKICVNFLHVVQFLKRIDKIFNLTKLFRIFHCDRCHRLSNEFCLRYFCSG